MSRKRTLPRVHKKVTGCERIVLGSGFEFFRFMLIRFKIKINVVKCILKEFQNWTFERKKTWHHLILENRLKTSHVIKILTRYGKI